MDKHDWAVLFAILFYAVCVAAVGLHGDTKHPQGAHCAAEYRK